MRRLSGVRPAMSSAPVNNFATGGPPSAGKNTGMPLIVRQLPLPLNSLRTASCGVRVVVPPDVNPPVDPGTDVVPGALCQEITGVVPLGAVAPGGAPPVG